MAATDHDIEILNRLIGSVLDSVDGFEEASQDAGQGRLDEFFDLRFKQRYDLSIKLQDHVRSLGGDPEGRGTALGIAHRTFTQLKSAIASGDAAVLAEVKRGEAHLQQQFEASLADPALTSTARSIIEEAYEIIRADDETIRTIDGRLSNRA